MSKITEIRNLFYKQAKARGEEREAIDRTLDTISKEFPDEFGAAFKALVAETNERANAVLCAQIVKSLQGVVVMRYIAEHYFHRSNAWLHQRINGNLIQGKPVSFSDAEVKIFKSALEDISRMIHDAAERL